MIMTAAPASRASGLPSPERDAAVTTRLRYGYCDLQLRNQGHDLQLP
jgi:hypothetical protein